jgi:cytochrome c553
MKKALYLCLACVFLLTTAGYILAGDAEAGKAKASTCSACHGDKGISGMSETPNLAGQQEQYLVNAMKSYRDSTRNNEIMKPMMESMSDEDIDNLAAYYSSLNCTGK